MGSKVLKQFGVASAGSIDIEFSVLGFLVDWSSNFFGSKFGIEIWLRFDDIVNLGGLGFLFGIFRFFYGGWKVTFCVWSFLAQCCL